MSEEKKKKLPKGKIEIISFIVISLLINILITFIALSIINSITEDKTFWEVFFQWFWFYFLVLYILSLILTILIWVEGEQIKYEYKKRKEKQEKRIAEGGKEKRYGLRIFIILCIIPLLIILFVWAALTFR